MRRSGILFAIGLILLITSARAQNSPAETKPTADDPDKTDDKEGCKLQPYKGDVPLSKLPFYVPDQPDFRGGIVCHYRIGPDLPLFTFHFLGKPDNTMGQLEVAEEPSTTIIQKIDQFTDWGMVSSIPELEGNLLTLVDANFDGYKDLQILSNCGATGNCSYDFFLYDPVSNQFVHNEFLSNLCSPEFDAKKKQITTHSNGSAADWENDTYQYEEGRYTMIHQEISSWDRQADKVTVNTYELRNGKMELVNSETDR